MSRYKAYPEYKEAGVEWLDAVPTHWSSVAIKYMALEEGSLFLDGDWIESKDISSDGIKYITTGNVGEGAYKEQGSGFISEETFSALNCTEVFPGDVLISRLNAPIGRACIVPSLDARVVTSVDNVIFRPDQLYSKEYLVRLFSSPAYFEHTTNLARGATMQRISRGLLGNIRVVVPPKIEQQKIVAFLDHETAKIDALIEKQQRLIELLKEKRQAVISHAVTKGLNPNAPMKDSGVEWLGEVPAHWDVLKLGYLMKLKGGAGFPDSYQGQEGHGIPFYKVGDLARANSESCLTESLHTVTYETANELRATIFNTGSIVFAKVGAALLLKRFCTLNKPSCIDNNMMGAEIRSIELRDFLLFVMPLLDFELIVNPGAVPSVNGEQITSILIALPPQDEQIEIVDFLKTSRIKFDHLIRNAEQAISLFQERRTALISAAVTGKIDVRDWQAAA